MVKEVYPSKCCYCGGGFLGTYAQASNYRKYKRLLYADCFNNLDKEIEEARRELTERYYSKEKDHDKANIS